MIRKSYYDYRMSLQYTGTLTYKGKWAMFDTATPQSYIPYRVGDVLTPDDFAGEGYASNQLVLCINPVAQSGINIVNGAGFIYGNTSPDYAKHWQVLTFRGTYNPAATYTACDVVSYNGLSYVASPLNPGPMGSNWILLKGYPPAAGVSCFLKDAPVLTPTGYRRIDSLKVGDLVQTAAGAVAIQAVKVRDITPSATVNPFVIPEGHLGATQDLAISPDHKVQIGGDMIEARFLGLERKEMKDAFAYYNLELPDHENMTVAGVIVESQYPIRRVTVTMVELHKMLIAKYGELTPAIIARVEKKVRMLTDGRVEVPVAK